MALLAETILHSTMQILSELACLGPNWDSYGAEPVAQPALTQARELVHVVAERLGQSADERVRPTCVAPLVDGGVQVEWDGPQRRIELEIGPQGELRCVLDRGRGVSPRILEKDDVSAEEAIQLILGTIAPPLLT